MEMNILKEDENYKLVVGEALLMTSKTIEPLKDLKQYLDSTSGEGTSKEGLEKLLGIMKDCT